MSDYGGFKNPKLKPSSLWHLAVSQSKGSARPTLLRMKLAPSDRHQPRRLNSDGMWLTSTVDEQPRVNTDLESLQYERGNHDT